MMMRMISWDYYCEGVWEDNFWDGDTHQCPETSFVAQSSEICN